MSAPSDSAIRTRMFARAFGPFFAFVPALIVIRAGSEMPVLFHEFVTTPIWQWVLGAVLFLWGSVIIAFHQYWRTPAAVLVSLLGWFLAIRGFLVLGFPNIYNSVGASVEHAGVLAIRIIFGLLVLIGLYLTYVGWIAKSPAHADA
ncbi:MAG: hypothetical protein AB7G47_01930 [Mycolicibacterium sp.]|uniref:hypothetical protein n=1 Tax=Mycolicibacterium sp. TaxID=2320850 RepID=UPI003D12D678